MLSFFFFTAPAPTAFYTLSLHDALPISLAVLQARRVPADELPAAGVVEQRDGHPLDRKSTRLNSSHMSISYAVFCLKKKNQRTRRAAGSLGGWRSCGDSRMRYALCPLGC